MTVFRDGYLTIIRGTTRIEPRRTDTSGTIRIPLLRLTRAHVPTYLTTSPYTDHLPVCLTHRSVQPVCSRVFPIVLIPQGALSVGDASFLSSSKGQSLFHRFTRLKFALHISTFFLEFQGNFSFFGYFLWFLQKFLHIFHEFFSTFYQFFCQRYTRVRCLPALVHTLADGLDFHIAAWITFFQKSDCLFFHNSMPSFCLFP